MREIIRCEKCHCLKRIYFWFSLYIYLERWIWVLILRILKELIRTLEIRIIRIWETLDPLERLSWVYQIHFECYVVRYLQINISKCFDHFEIDSESLKVMHYWLLTLKSAPLKLKIWISGASGRESKLLESLNAAIMIKACSKK